jgi:hypothetical protein
MTDGRVRPTQEAVYMEMKVRGLGRLGKEREGGVAVPPKKELEDYCIE